MRRIIVGKCRAFCSFVLFVVATIGLGCGSTTFAPMGFPMMPPTPATIHMENGPNNFFQTAQLIDLNNGPQGIIGEIDSVVDVDVYDLGAVEVGDLIIAQLDPGDTGVMALFDETGALLLVNDHRNVFLGRVEVFIEIVIRRPGDSCYLAVATTPGFGGISQYTIVAYKVPNQSLPVSYSATVILVFEETWTIHIGSRATISISDFDGADISPVFENDTQQIMDLVVSNVRIHFAAYDVEVLSTHEGSSVEPWDTKLYFGGYDASILGLAEGVDEFNTTSGQSAIVFVETFSAFMRLQPTVAEIAHALSNVASHEIGHLLGLIHTADMEAVTDVTASLNSLLIPQTFRRSAIHDTVFPIGAQDAHQMLIDNVGGVR